MAKEKKQPQDRPWSWNQLPQIEETPGSVFSQTKHQADSELQALSAHLVSLMAVLHEAEETFLDEAQRRRAGRTLHESYLRLQKLASASYDPEMRRRLTQLLVVVSLLAVTPIDAEANSTGEPFSLFDALSQGRVNEWMDYLYLALHQAPVPSGRSKTCYWCLNQEVFLELRDIRRDLMHWIDHRQG